MTTELGVKQAIKRLVRSGYNAPDDIDALVKEWRDILSDISDLELSSATASYLKEDNRYFPRAGALRRLALDARPRPTYSDAEPVYDVTKPCPVCGAVLRSLSPNDQVNTVWFDEFVAVDGRTVKGSFRNGGATATGSSRFGVLHDRQKHMAARVPAIGYWR